MNKLQILVLIMSLAGSNAYAAQSSEVRIDIALTEVEAKASKEHQQIDSQEVQVARIQELINSKLNNYLKVIRDTYLNACQWDYNDSEYKAMQSFVAEIDKLFPTAQTSKGDIKAYMTKLSMTEKELPDLVNRAIDVPLAITNLNGNQIEYCLPNSLKNSLQVYAKSKFNCYQVASKIFQDIKEKLATKKFEECVTLVTTMYREQYELQDEWYKDLSSRYVITSK